MGKTNGPMEKAARTLSSVGSRASSLKKAELTMNECGIRKEGKLDNNMTVLSASECGGVCVEEGSGEWQQVPARNSRPAANSKQVGKTGVEREALRAPSPPKDGRTRGERIAPDKEKTAEKMAAAAPCGGAGQAAGSGPHGSQANVAVAEKESRPGVVDSVGRKQKEVSEARGAGEQQDCGGGGGGGEKSGALVYDKDRSQYQLLS